MSFCFLLNAVMLFTGVLAFILAGFAGTFSRRLQGCRYRLMLAPLGFVVLGSIARSATTGLMAWFIQAAVTAHQAQIGHPAIVSGAAIFGSVVLLLAGTSGMLAGLSLGARLDRVPVAEQTYTIANYWARRAPTGTTGLNAAIENSVRSRGNVIPISDRMQRAGVVSRIRAIPEND